MGLIIRCDLLLTLRRSVLPTAIFPTSVDVLTEALSLAICKYDFCEALAMNENETCRQLIEPALQGAGWSWDRHLRLGPGRVNISGGSMYDVNQDLVLDPSPSVR